MVWRPALGSRPKRGSRRSILLRLLAWEVLLVCEWVDKADGATHFIELRIFKQDSCFDEQVFERLSDGIGMANDRHFALDCCGWKMLDQRMVVWREDLLTSLISLRLRSTGSDSVCVTAVGRLLQSLIAGTRLQALENSHVHLSSRDFIPLTFSFIQNSIGISRFKMPPKSGEKRVAPDSPTGDDSGGSAPKQTTRQREMKTYRHAPAPASGIRAQQGSGVLR